MCSKLLEVVEPLIEIERKFKGSNSFSANVQFHDLKDIDLIFDIFKNLLDETSRFWHPSFPKVVCPRYLSRMIFVFSFKVVWRVQSQNNWFWESRSCPRGPKIMIIMTFGIWESET